MSQCPHPQPLKPVPTSVSGVLRSQHAPAPTRVHNVLIPSLALERHAMHISTPSVMPRCGGCTAGPDAHGADRVVHLARRAAAKPCRFQYICAIAMEAATCNAPALAGARRESNGRLTRRPVRCARSACRPILATRCSHRHGTAGLGGRHWAAAVVRGAR